MYQRFEYLGVKFHSRRNKECEVAGFWDVAMWILVHTGKQMDDVGVIKVESETSVRVC